VTDLQLAIHRQHAGEAHTAHMVKVVSDAEHVTVTGKIVPLVYVNTVQLVGHNLQNIDW